MVPNNTTSYFKTPTNTIKPSDEKLPETSKFEPLFQPDSLKSEKNTKNLHSDFGFRYNYNF